jgi:hypothetical protein
LLFSYLAMGAATRGRNGLTGPVSLAEDCGQLPRDESKYLIALIQQVEVASGEHVQGAIPAGLACPERYLIRREFRVIRRGQAGQRNGERWLWTVCVCFAKFEVSPDRRCEPQQHATVSQGRGRGTGDGGQPLEKSVVFQFADGRPPSWHIGGPVTGQEQVRWHRAARPAQQPGQLEGQDGTHTVPEQGERPVKQGCQVLWQRADHLLDAPERLFGAVLSPPRQLNRPDLG